MKIRIVGPCGSGKSTVARKLSHTYEIPYYELDNLIWDRSETGKKYPREVRDASLQRILERHSWIVEGVHTHWALETFRDADLIFILEPHVLVRDYRIIRRFIRSRTGIEEWNYVQSFANLYKMIVEWNHGYRGKDILSKTEEYAAKRIMTADNETICRMVDEYLRLECRKEAMSHV